MKSLFIRITIKINNFQRYVEKEAKTKEMVCINLEINVIMVDLINI